MTGSRGVPSAARGWSVEEEEDLVESIQAGMTVEAIAERHQTSTQEVFERAVQLGWLTPDRDADSTIEDMLAQRDNSPRRPSDQIRPDGDERESFSGWHLWRELSAMVTAQIAGGTGYHSIQSVLEQPERWLAGLTLGDPTFPDELADVASSIDNAFLITSKPEQVIQRVWDLRRVGTELGNFSVDSFAGLSEPYYAIFFGCDQSPVLGRLSDSTLLAAFRRRFRLKWFDVEVAAEVLGNADGDIKPHQALNQYVVPESQIETFIRHYEALLQDAAEDGQEDLLRHTRRLSAERLALIDDLQGLNDWDDEPEFETEPSELDYEPDDPDDYERVQDAIDPDMPEDDEPPTFDEDGDY